MAEGIFESSVASLSKGTSYHLVFPQDEEGQRPDVMGYTDPELIEQRDVHLKRPKRVWNKAKE